MNGYLQPAGQNLNYSNAGSQALPSSAIVSAQSTLDDNTTRLHGIIGELETRLLTVLGPSKPQGVGEKSMGPPASVAARIRESANCVAGAINRIEDILSRLEV
jgi:hypothetical protein